LCIS
jgi:hypothetical protein